MNKTCNARLRFWTGNNTHSDCMSDSNGNDRAWCEQLADEYRVPVSSVEQVLTGLKGSREGTLILLEACAECALDPVATLNQARNASGPFRISRPEPTSGEAAPARAELAVPPPKARTAIPRRRREADRSIFADRAARSSGMAAEIYLAMFQRATRS
jgi:hypothetical protein